MNKLAKLTSDNNYFEDFEVGQTIKHARGKDITNLENVYITNLVMNTAQGHFNSDYMASNRFKQIISYGGVNFSVVLGLASQDCIENALRELSMDNIKLTSPVLHGDTLYAYSRVLEKRDADREDAGIVVFQHWGVNQKDVIVAEVQRTALIKRKSHWC